MAYKRQGKISQAIEVYSKAVSIYKEEGESTEYANILNSIGDLYKS